MKPIQHLKPSLKRASSDMAARPDNFEPLYVEHLIERCPSILKYLGLAPGWRFLLAPNYEDLWFDEKLLHISQS